MAHGAPLEADVYVLSYPKAGRTWLRAMVGKLLVDRLGLTDRRILETEFLTRRAGLPTVAFDHDGSAMRFNVRWQDMPTRRDAYAGKRVVLLGRDARDNLVSAYFQATRRIGVWNGPVKPFLRDDRYGIDKLLTFFRIWSENQRVPAEFMYITYEAMHRAPAATLAAVLPVMGIGADTAAIDAAVDYCRFDNLQKAEAESRFRGSALVPGRVGDPESFKVRKGKVGNFREYLDADDIGYIDRAVAERGCPFTRATLVRDSLETLDASAGATSP